ncbi:MAG: hypothetical protein EU548_04415 [Promethearchaeota archaeon]|nr:MAG: hypothetical protein EU548_04415 [Candidatus Lokiarchaeota archaeon]
MASIIFSPTNRFLWSIATVILLICGINYIIRGLKREEKNERLMMHGFAGLWMGFALTRFFFYFSDYFIIGEYSGHDFVGDFINTTYIYEMLHQFGYLCSFIGFLLFFLAFEKVTKITRFSFTIFNIISINLIIFLPFEATRVYVYVASIINGVIFIWILAWFFEKSAVDFQAVFSFMMIAFTLFFIGWILDSTAIKELDLINPVIAPTLIIIGALVAITPSFINPDYFSRPLVLWVIFIFIVIAVFIIFIVTAIFILPFEIFVISIIGAIVLFVLVMVYCGAQIINILNPYKRAQVKEKESKNFLKIFAKPKNITEKEITVAKEKKLCLVCKNKIRRYNYQCPDCDSLYCLKCAKILTKTENACWVCGTPFDKSKPVKKMEEVQHVDIDVKKGKKPKKKNDKDEQDD